MLKISREYYSLTDTALKVGCPVTDLIHLASKGDIKLIVLTLGLPALRIKNKIIDYTQRYESITQKYCYIRQDNMALLEANHNQDSLSITVVHPSQDVTEGWLIDDRFAIPMCHDSLYMLTTDIEGLIARGVIEPIASPSQINHAGTEPKERELKDWLRETWINEGSKLGGTAFFTRLKKYVNKDGSPIVEHYSAGKSAGFRWETSAGATGTTTKKTIQNIVSVFKNTP